MTTSRFSSVVSGPRSHLPAAERRERRSSIRSLRVGPDGLASRPRILLLYGRTVPPRLESRFDGGWWRALSRLLAGSLDRQLADGQSPESSLLLAARSQVLASPVTRQALAYQLADVLTRARTPPRMRSPRVTINREAVSSNEVDIRAVSDLLASPTLAPVQGIAMLSCLVSDGTGPLYNRRRSDELSGALAQAAAVLESSEVFPSGSVG